MVQEVELVENRCKPVVEAETAEEEVEIPEGKGRGKGKIWPWRDMGG